jgi:DNA-binding winged helix-turn-helix (wHTH) protein
MKDGKTARRYRFGAFEADAATGELRKHGVRLKVNAQPFQVLMMLLDRPGELLTRAEISRELWQDGTFVDYEHGVNSAVNRIREALGDKAKNPRFIETLARRGYRFVGAVERIGVAAVDEAAPVAVEPAIEVLVEPVKAWEGLLASAEELPKTPPRTVQILFLLLQLMYLGFYIGALANLTEIEELLSVLPQATEWFLVLVVTAGVLIPVRLFMVCGLLFHAPRLSEKLLKLWPYLLPFDILWALSPFLLLHHVNFGMAMACMAVLVYSPFAQRALVMMGVAGERFDRN